MYTWGHEFHENSSSISKQWHVEVASQVSHLPQEGNVAQMQRHNLRNRAEGVKSTAVHTINTPTTTTQNK